MKALHNTDFAGVRKEENNCYIETWAHILIQATIYRNLYENTAHEA